MKKLLVAGAITAAHFLLAETPEEAYARVSACRDVWNTNALAYVKQVAIGDDPALAEAKAKWFVDVLGFPDVTETNRLGDVLYAKEKFLTMNAGLGSVIGNTNCWYAVADFIARLKAEADPEWQFAEGKNFFRAVSNYRQDCLETYVRQHANSVSRVDPTNSFYREWHSMFRNKRNREIRFSSALNSAKQRMKMDFWWFGTENMSEAEKSVCRSKIVARAHLTPAEEHFIFDDKPDLYYKIKGINKPRDGDR